MEIILSILVCTIKERGRKVRRLVRELHRQAEGLPVQIIWLGDNKTMSVGEKRNGLLKLATGNYVSFIDDDDKPRRNYVLKYLQACKLGLDVVTAECKVKNRVWGGMAIFKKEFLVNVDMGKERIYLRMPNHLCAVKRELALQAMFPEKNMGEDSAYALRLSKLIKTEYHIPEILYTYKYNPKKSKTSKFDNDEEKTAKREYNVLMDIVIVSDGTDWKLRQMTQECIGTLQNPMNNVVAVEGCSAVKYSNATMVYQKEPFNYNGCMNEGATKGDAPFICFTNNDVMFQPYFSEAAIQEVIAKSFKYGHVDVLGIPDQNRYAPDEKAECITGWTFVMRRDSFDKMGGLSTDYSFYCADNVVWQKLKEMKMKYSVSKNITVYHLGSTTLKTVKDTGYATELTEGQVRKFNKDYNKKIFDLV